MSQDTASIFACVLAVDLGDHDHLRRCVPRLGALDLDSLPFATKHEAFLGLVEVLDGRQAEGIARTRAALDRCGGRNFYPGFQAAIARVLLAAHTIAGDGAGGVEACARMLALGSTPLWDAELHRARAEFLHQAGAGAEEVGAALGAAEAVATSQAAGGHLRRIEATRLRLAAGPAPAGRDPHALPRPPHQTLAKRFLVDTARHDQPHL